jgi:Ca-activated chloride channel family protein
MTRRAALLVIAAGLCVGLATRVRAGQTQRPRETVIAVSVIRVPVTVLDGRNRFVLGLKQTDFDVLEDGVAQEITSTTLSESPVAAVLLIDVSGSMTSRLDEAKRAAVQFVRQMGPRDVTKVMQFDERVTALSEFSADKAQLEASIGKAKVGGATALYNALKTAIADLEVRKDADTDVRRAIVVLSDGEDTSSATKPEEVIFRAKAADAMIYAVSLDRVNAKPVTDSASAIFLRELADQTGGQLSFPDVSDLPKLYRQLADELRHQYVLGYVSSNTRLRFRTIAVRVKNRTNLKLRHRLGYYPAGSRSTQ